MRNEKLEVVRNHDYTVSIRDGKGREIVFRDITGNDLEYLDRLFENDENKDSEKKIISFSDVQNILSRLSIDNFNFGSLTPRVISEIFSCIKDNILCNYVSKYSWLKMCYGMQNGSFMNVSNMENVPMTKFVAMAQIHREAMESMDKNE